MSNLIIMIVCCCFCAAISQRRSNDFSRRRIFNNEQLFFTFIACYMIIFAGLRTYFNDTTIYVRGFRECPKFPDVLSSMDWTISEHPGFRLFQSFIKTFSDNVNVFLMLSSMIALYPALWFVRKYTKSFAFSLFIFFMLGYYAFCLAAIKQTMSVAIALISLDRYLNGKKLSYILYLLLASTFHVYVLIYFITPIIAKQIPWGKGTWILLISVLLITYSFNFFIGSIIKITDILGDSYDAKSFVGEGINIFRVLIYFIPPIISFLWRATLFSNSSKSDNLFVNMSIICSLIMFIGLFGNANLFSRLAFFFQVPITIALPFMLHKMKYSLNGIIIKSGLCFAYPLFFYYQMVITSDFENNFRSISLGEFFSSLF